MIRLFHHFSTVSLVNKHDNSERNKVKTLECISYVHTAITGVDNLQMYFIFRMFIIDLDI